ncbi:CoA pyrophosphatase [Bacillus sp. REN10]|uniref:NUDIX hydrolase n=1 Tax=Bacillus sp. REN10 TaxID=2782541 RepID=UPI00193BAF30|nr:CoA pyrophosphatase [Bacillus sp. REN10]
MKTDQLLKQFHQRTPTILGSEHFSKYAVLLPLVEKEGEIHILFQVRSLQMRNQPGEVCFPGGRIEKFDKSEFHTAIRETSEELGINPSDITQVFSLDFIVSPFGTMIYPFAGCLLPESTLKPNQDEVEQLFTVPLDYLLQHSPKKHHIHFKVEPEENFPFDLIIGGENYNWRPRKMEEYFYFYEDKIIWGLTARILKHFLDLLKDQEVDLENV